MHFNDELIAANERLKASEERFRAVIDSAGDALYIHDFDGKILQTNKRAQQDLGYTEQEFKNMTVMDVDSDYPNVEDLRHLWAALKDGNQIAYGHHKRKDGSIFPIEVHLSTYSDENGTNIVAVVRNISERQKMEQELIRKNKELQNFVYIVSHNLRSPVASLQGLTSILNYSSNSDSTPEMSKAVKMIERCVNKLDDTLKDLNQSLSYQKNNSVIEEVEVRPLIESILELLNGDIVEHKAQIKLDIHLNCVGAVKAYLHNIIFNMVLNAINYRDYNKPLKIVIKAYSDSDNKIISVEDNGIGMELCNSTKDTIFQMYGRHSNRVGKGLGLYLSKIQAESMGAQITVESQLGKGSSFSLVFQNYPH
ncbi:MAG: PAS domain-containing sensor histidine kinase [Bacteroidetes bacterium]|nr:PAS domain-containing sensor histidine kinase [Bacteroidota bacterium]